jgi:hypothetical protein
VAIEIFLILPQRRKRSLPFMLGFSADLFYEGSFPLLKQVGPLIKKFKNRNPFLRNKCRSFFENEKEKEKESYLADSGNSFV